MEVALTADGRTLVWRQDTPGTGTFRDIFAMPVDSPSVARAILQTRFNERGIAVGPEGDWLAYAPPAPKGREAGAFCDLAL